ncbi:MAG: biotin/lipoyl-binding protein [Thermoplasmata archaeon]|nr:biotin/lipoyl-binding protein [Thermoplasmata archaeon]
MEFQYEYAGKSYPVRMARDGDRFTATIGDKKYSVSSKEIKPGFFIIQIDGKPVKVSIASEGNHRHIFHAGAVYRFTKLDGRRKKGEEGEISPEITSPISGKLVKVDSEEGKAVEEGQTLMTIEAMKMEYQIKAPYEGLVEKVNFKEGEQVDIGMVLIVMEKKAVEETASDDD